MVTPSIARSGAGLSVNQAWRGRLPFGRWVCLLANTGPTARFQMLGMQKTVYIYNSYIMCMYVYVLICIHISLCTSIINIYIYMYIYVF